MCVCVRFSCLYGMQYPTTLPILLISPLVTFKPEGSELYIQVRPHQRPLGCSVNSVPSLALKKMTHTHTLFSLSLSLALSLLALQSKHEEVSQGSDCLRLQSNSHVDNLVSSNWVWLLSFTWDITNGYGA